jgi:DNA end-binding protein Ku
MVPRANWKGYLKLSLVSCAVALFPATSTRSRVRFNIINRETGNRVHNQIVDAETGEPVEEEDRVKGYREGSRYVLVEEEELDRVALESTHTIDVEAFVPRDEVDLLYLDESYYLVPEDKAGHEAFAVIREAMRKADLVGIARVVLYRRERLLMIQPRGKGILATSLRYKNEVRAKDAYFDDLPAVKISPEMLALAIHILESKRAHFDPSKFDDRYEKALKDLIKAKRAGKEPPEPPSAPPSNVINLMDALRRSVKSDRGGRAVSSRGSARRPSSRSPAKRRTSAKRRLKKAG